MTNTHPPSETTPPQIPLECDIVMAGGVTSGVIYPGAVSRIARRYRFRCIGGTSIGALAAAVVAAAELGRTTGRNPSAFDEVLAPIPESLGDTGTDGDSRLLHLFTPDPTTRALFTLFRPLLRGGSLWAKSAGVIWASLRIPQVAAATLFALAVWIYSLWALPDSLLRVFALVGGLLTLALSWGGALAWIALKRWRPALIANGYGLCSGMAAPSEDVAPTNGPPFQGLTPWLHALVQRAAGRSPDEPPVTFGDLWGDAPDRRAIELAMIVTDVSRNRSVQAPFMEALSPLYIENTILDAYFPQPIAEHIRSHKGEDDRGAESCDGVIRLPAPQHLPIVFCARMSLSFPILLSAIPMLTPDFGGRARSKDGKSAPLDQRVWFSDGGLTSNFPIHFFDSPIPSRPTFGLNLIEYNEEAPGVARNGENEDGGDGDGDAKTRSAKPLHQAQAPARLSTAERIRPHFAPGDPEPYSPVWGFVEMTDGNRPSPAPFSAFGSGRNASVLGFIGALFNAARAWNDNQIMAAPGVRDRIVNIALREDEGGLNLNMATKVLSDLDWRGRAAGLLISARFDPCATQDPETGGALTPGFPRHRWTRYRSMMAAFEGFALQFSSALARSDAAATQRGEKTIAELIQDQTNVGYPIPKTAQPYYHGQTQRLDGQAKSMLAARQANPINSFARPKNKIGAPPRPEQSLRLRPKPDNDPLKN